MRSSNYEWSVKFEISAIPRASYNIQAIVATSLHSYPDPPYPVPLSHPSFYWQTITPLFKFTNPPKLTLFPFEFNAPPTCCVAPASLNTRQLPEPETIFPRLAWDGLPRFPKLLRIETRLPFAGILAWTAVSVLSLARRTRIVPKYSAKGWGWRSGESEILTCLALFDLNWAWGDQSRKKGGKNDSNLHSDDNGRCLEPWRF